MTATNLSAAWMAFCCLTSSRSTAFPRETDLLGTEGWSLTSGFGHKRYTPTRNSTPTSTNTAASTGFFFRSSWYSGSAVTGANGLGVGLSTCGAGSAGGPVLAGPAGTTGGVWLAVVGGCSRGRGFECAAELL